MSSLCLFGKGTKISKYLIDHDKIYETTIKLGIKTDTDDIEGKTLAEKEVNLSNLEEEKLKEILKKFLGKQEQVPPIYSAIKVKGKKLYEYAREGRENEIEIKPRQIEIYSIELEKINKQEKEITLKLHVSKGTYIRSLCRDISEALRRNRHNENFKQTKSAETLT